MVNSDKNAIGDQKISATRNKMARRRRLEIRIELSSALLLCI